MDYVGSPSWTTVNCLTTILCIIGNLLTIVAITTSRQLSSLISNRFILSLAVSDLLVGIAIPYHVSFYLYHLGGDRIACLVRFVLISFSWCGSIVNLFLIASDRYFAILHPLIYQKKMDRRSTTMVIVCGWTFSLTLASVLIVWNRWDPRVECDVNVIPSSYFLGALTPLFALVWSAIFVVYLKIWRETVEHSRRHNGSVSDTKSVQVVMLTLGCFTACWMPYFIVTTYYRISNNASNFSLLYEIAFTLAGANSAINPLIYAWKNSNFRQAFVSLLRCRSPNSVRAKSRDYVTDHVPKSQDQKINRESVSTEATSIDLSSKC